MMLMKLKPEIFWSPCAAHCIDFMLEGVAQGKVMQRGDWKVKKILIFSIKHELLQSSMTRFATNFIDIECLQV